MSNQEFLAILTPVRVARGSKSAGFKDTGAKRPGTLLGDLAGEVRA